MHAPTACDPLRRGRDQHRDPQAPTMCDPQWRGSDQHRHPVEGSRWMAQAILRESFSTSNFGKWNAAVKAAHPSPKWTTQMPRRPLAVAAIWCSMSATWTTTRPGLSGRIQVAPRRPELLGEVPLRRVSHVHLRRLRRTIRSNSVLSRATAELSRATASPASSAEQQQTSGRAQQSNSVLSRATASSAEQQQSNHVPRARRHSDQVVA